MVSVKGGKPCITLGLMSVRQRWIFVCWLMGWTVNENKSLPNGISSAEAVINWLVMQKRDPKQARLVMEATGIYHED